MPEGDARDSRRCWSDEILLPEPSGETRADDRPPHPFPAGGGDRKNVPAAGDDLHHAPQATIPAGDRDGALFHLRGLEGEDQK